MMLILTGERGAGKTTLVRDLLEEQGITAQGFLSVKEMEGGAVTGISLLILPERKLIPMATTTPMVTEAFTKRFYFHPGVFDRVNGRFRDIGTGCPFIFDEFGLLEREGKGHYPVFRTLLQTAHPSLVMVQRDLVNDLLSMIGNGCPYETADMTALDPAGVRSRVMAFLQGAVAG